MGGCAIPACIVGGIPACLAAGLRGGACCSRGSAPGGVCSRGDAWWRPPRDGYCCGRYASYWNAFLSSNVWTLYSWFHYMFCNAVYTLFTQFILKFKIPILNMLRLLLAALVSVYFYLCCIMILNLHKSHWHPNTLSPFSSTFIFVLIIKKFKYVSPRSLDLRDQVVTLH